MIDRQRIGELTLHLLDDLEEEQGRDVRSLIVVVELEDEESTTVRIYCTTGDTTTQAGILARALDAALDPAE